MGKSISKNFTIGSIPKQLLLFMLPFMASNALQVLYTTVDMIVVGHFVGTAGLAAVAQTSQMVNFSVMVCFGFSSAGQVLVAQALGANKREELNKIIGTLFSFVILLAIILSIIMLIACNGIIDIMNVPPESIDMSRQYFVISIIGLIFTAGYNMVSSVLRGMGDSKRPFIFIGIASAANLVLDLLFTGLFGWGVAGAALATIIGQAISLVFAICYLYKKREEFGFDFRKESFRLAKKYVKHILSLGTPMAIQSAAINISMLFVNTMINGVGVVASATFGAGIKIDDIINKISIGIQHAAMPMISQNIAAKQQKRAKKTVYWAWTFSISFTIVCMAAYILFGKELFMMFSDDAAVHQMCGTFISAILWMFPALAIMRGTGAFIQGIGNARFTMVLALLDGVILRIGLSWLFGRVLGWDFFGYVLGYGLAPYGFAIPGAIYFLSGIWKKRKTLADDM